MKKAHVAPTEIRLKNAGKLLVISFDHAVYELEAELLRVESPSAEVQGHSAAQKQLIHGKRNVAIIGIDPIGNYAVKLNFDDMHNTGIYTWEILENFGLNKQKLWNDYLKALAAKGVSR